MMLMIESAAAVRLAAATSFCCSSATATTTSTNTNTTYLPRYGSSGISRNRFRRLSTGSLLRKSSNLKNRIRVSAKHLGLPSDSSQQNDRFQYHPFEEIGKSSSENAGDVTLTPQETARTIVELNSKATLMLTGLIGDDFHENIIWSDLPYLTDEHGNIYFQVKNDEDILQTLTSENNFVQTIIGFDALELLGEMEFLGPSEIDFGFEEIEDEDSEEEDDDEDEDEDDEDGDYDEDVVAIIKDEDAEDDSEESLGDWAKLETMRSSHPMYFAKKLSQVASDDPIDWMEQPPAGLAIHGVIRPAFSEEHSDIKKHMLGNQSSKADINGVGRNLEDKREDKVEDIGMINGHKHESRSSEDGLVREDEGEQDEVPITATSFYRLEMIKIQLISAHGHRVLVEVDDFRRAQPDTIALSAAKIISRLKDGGEKVTKALQSLCLRCKGIQVEEAAVINLDSLGFDLRVCSGTQIQTLRFAFNSRATSEYSAERQLNDILFPDVDHKAPKEERSQQNED